MSARVPSRMSVLTLSILPILSVILVAHRAQNQAAPPPQGTGLVVGRILELTSHGPVIDAVASLIDAKGHVVESVRTTDDGSFVFRDVPAGNFNIGAMKTGYESTSASQRRTPVSISDGQRIGNVVVLLRKYSSVSGTVFDDGGDPIVGASVELMMKDDRGWWVAVGASKPTDDRGVYRVANLRPGQYMAMLPSTAVSVPLAKRSGPAPSKTDLSSIGAVGLERGLPTSMEMGGNLVGLSKLAGPPHPSSGGTLVTYAPTFAPDVSDASRARSFTVASGTAVSGIDFHLLATPASSVSGSVLMDDGTPAANVAVRLVEQDSPLRARDIEVASTLSDSTGRFTFPVVPAGTFVVNVVRRPIAPPPSAGTGVQIEGSSAAVPMSGSATAPAPQAGRGETLWASAQTSTVSGTVSDVTLTLRRGISVTGHVLFEGDQAPPEGVDLSKLTINFLSTYGRNDRYVSTRPSADRTFSASGLLPGLYSITAGLANIGGPVTWRMKSATIDGHDAADRFAVSDQDVHDVVVTMTQRLPAVAGTVHDDQNRPVQRAVVLLFPSDKKEWDNVAFRRFKSAVTSGTGAYSIADVPSGDYFVTAVADDETPGWRDPEVLAQLATTAQRVTVPNNQDATATISLGKLPSREPTSLPEVALEATAHGPFVAEDAATLVQARDVIGAPRAGPGRLDGVVTLAGTSAKPVRMAAVTLVSVDGSIAQTTFTDDQGRFSFEALPAGRFHVAAAKAGLFSMEYGAKRPGALGTAIAMAEGARQHVSLSVVPGGVIAGVVRDMAGRPVVGVNVTALVKDPLTNAFRPAQVASPSSGREMTDDRGEYRIFGLPAGEFVIGTDSDGAAGIELTGNDVASAQRELRAPGNAGDVRPAARRPQTYASAFAPSATDAAQATRVKLQAGEERANVDIQVPLVVANTVAGRVVGSEGVGRSARIVLMPQNPYVPADTRIDSPGHGTSFGGAVSFATAPSGEFVIADVAPGTYTLIARGSASGGVAATSWATTTLTIADQDVAGLTLSLQPGLEVTGHLAAESALPSNVNQIKVGLDALGAEGLAVTVPPVAVDATGAFSLKGVFPGRYRVRITGAPNGWLSESAMISGRDAMDVPADFAAGAAVPDIVVRLSPQASEIAGAFSDLHGDAATDYYVVLFSNDRETWLPQARRVQAVRPDADGRFRLKNLPAGHYWLAAVTDVEPNEWNDASFLASLVPSAIAIDLAAGEHKVQNIALAGK